MAQRLLLAAVGVAAIAMAAFWGLGAAGVFLFFVAIPLLITLALNVGGTWLTRTSRARFAEKPRR